MSVRMVECPNCWTLGCSFCKPHGPFGLVPDGVDVEISLKTGMSPQPPPLHLRLRGAMGRWLTTAGAVAELEHEMHRALDKKREKWGNDDEENDDGLT